MPRKIQIRRGRRIDIPILEDGELGFTTDTHELYIGTNQNGVLENVPISATSTEEQLKTFLFSQSTPSLEWAITHSLERFVNVTIIDSAGTQIEGDVQIINNSLVIVKFSSEFSGVAILS